MHQRKYDCLHLYKAHGIYWYNGGVNWRAVLAFVVGVAPSLPGFAASINKNINVGVGVHPYQFGWLLGFSSTAVLYGALSLGFKAKETFIERGIEPDEVYDLYEGEEIEGVETEVEELGMVGEKGGMRKWAEKIL